MNNNSLLKKRKVYTEPIGTVHKIIGFNNLMAKWHCSFCKFETESGNKKYFPDWKVGDEKIMICVNKKCKSRQAIPVDDVVGAIKQVNDWISKNVVEVENLDYFDSDKGEWLGKVPCVNVLELSKQIKKIIGGVK